MVLKVVWFWWFRMTTQLIAEKEGWGHPGYARKAHYFRHRESICGRYSWKIKPSLKPNVTQNRKCIVCLQKLVEEQNSGV